MTNSLLSEEVAVKLNRRIFDYDQLVCLWPVFPHEVVGFSGGNKYFFPGIAGSEMINFTHWLGAMITSWHVMSTVYTPVRAVIERAAEFMDRPVPASPWWSLRKELLSIAWTAFRDMADCCDAVSSEAYCLG